MHILEAYEQIGKIVQNDTRNRVNKYVTKIDSACNAGRIKHSDKLVGYIPIDEETGRIVPTKPIRNGFGKWKDQKVLHFVDEALTHQQPSHADQRYVYWFDISAECEDARIWPGFQGPDLTYIPTKLLLQLIWKQCHKGFGALHQKLPALPLYDLKEITGNKSLMNRIEQMGASFKMATYQSRSEVKSIDRMVSDGFLTEVVLPGSYHVWDLTTVDEATRLLTFIQEQLNNQDLSRSPRDPSGNDEKAGEHDDFLSGLKAQCYAIKGSYGNHVGEAVFEVYKSVARYLNPLKG